MLQPPPTDRELTVDIVRRTLGEQFPDLPLRKIERLGPGWEYEAYLIDDRLVVRFPRYADIGLGLEWKEALLEFVAAGVAGAVDVPRITLKGEPSRHFPHPFFGHELIRGVDANDPRAPESLELARGLGRALTAIHSISLASAEAMGLKPQKMNCRTAFDGLQELVDTVPEMQELVPGPYEWLRTEAEVPAEYAGPPRVLHDDLQPEHIIVSETTGRLSGIVDWGPSLGDPAQDLTFIQPWRGWRFTSVLLEAYELPVDDQFLERLDFLCRVRALGALGYALNGVGDVGEGLRWVQNAFGG
jgi:aminoglycoside 2''-phosphotransferase